MVKERRDLKLYLKTEVCLKIMKEFVKFLQIRRLGLTTLLNPDLEPDTHLFWILKESVIVTKQI